MIVIPRAASGTELMLRAIPFNRGYGSVEYRTVEDLLTITFADLPAYRRRRRCRR